MDNIISRFSALAVNMEEYYVNSFKEFFEQIGYSKSYALVSARNAAKEQIEIDKEAVLSRKRDELRKRIKYWSEAASEIMEEKELQKLLEDLSIN